MDTLEIVAVVLIVAGILGLAYGGITHSRTTHDAKVGPIAVSIQEKETLDIPVWAGIGAIVVGTALLLGRRK